MDNIIKKTMYIITNKYQTQLITKLIINNLHYNFKIINNKLIFLHKVDINEIIKLLNKNYLKYKLIGRKKIYPQK